MFYQYSLVKREGQGLGEPALIKKGGQFMDNNTQSRVGYAGVLLTRETEEANGLTLLTFQDMCKRCKDLGYKKLDDDMTESVMSDAEIAEMVKAWIDDVAGELDVATLREVLQRKLIYAAESLLSVAKAGRTAEEIDSFSEKSRIYDMWKSGSNIDGTLLAHEASARNVELQMFMSQYVEPQVIAYRKMVSAQKAAVAELWSVLDGLQSVDSLNSFDPTVEVTNRFQAKMASL